MNDFSQAAAVASPRLYRLEFSAVPHKEALIEHQTGGKIKTGVIPQTESYMSSLAIKASYASSWSDCCFPLEALSLLDGWIDR